MPSASPTLIVCQIDHGRRRRTPALARDSDSPSCHRPAASAPSSTWTSPRRPGSRPPRWDGSWPPVPSMVFDISFAPDVDLVRHQRDHRRPGLFTAGPEVVGHCLCPICTACGCRHAANGKALPLPRRPLVADSHLHLSGGPSGSWLLYRMTLAPYTGMNRQRPVPPVWGSRAVSQPWISLPRAFRSLGLRRVTAAI